MYHRINRILFYTALLIFIRISVSAAEPQKIFRMTKQIDFDGSPFEDAWNEPEHLPLVMHRPDFGSRPSEVSEVMITYDEEFLWVGARLFTKDPQSIRSTSKKRDEQSRNSDAFAIILDTFDDNENALAFGTMPSGLRFDYTVANDANMSSGAAPGTPGGGTMNISWNTFWDVKTSRDDKGWYVEMRIPFSSLRFQPSGDKVTMGLIINRAISYRNELDTYPEIDPKYGMMASIKPSLAAPIEFADVRPGKPVYVSPYTKAGYTSDNTLNNEGTDYVSDKSPHFDAGLDVKYNLTSNLTMDLTVNTDFAQVEADDQQVNLTRYSLFFPEKRLFFQERSSIFSYNLGGPSDMFYSRRIGIEDGTPIRIYGGAKVIGRAGKWDIGFLDMQTEVFDTVPSNNFGVARLRRQVFNPNSYVGGLVTSKAGADGSYDLSYGLDGIIRIFGDDYLDLKLAQNFNNNKDFDLTSMTPTFLRTNWERRSDKGFSYNLTYSYSGEQFDPQIGFLRYTGVQGFESEFRYGWLPGSESRVFRTSVTLQANRISRLADGRIENITLSPGYEIFTKSGLGGIFMLKYNQEGVKEDFNLTDEVMVLAGDYSFYSFEAMIFTPQSKPYSSMIMLSSGQYYDGNKFSVMVSPVMSISQSLQITGGYQYSYVNFKEREQKLISHVINMKVLYMFNTKLSASMLVQYNNSDNVLVGNFRLRYNPKEGNDFYLVYDENRNTGDSHMLPEPPSYYSRSVVVKYTHTFRL
jgi:hypothetical protein